jgi:hypothetical protein
VRGISYVVLATVNGLGDFLSSTIFGLLWTAFNPVVGFACATILFFASAVVVYRAK